VSLYGGFIPPPVLPGVLPSPAALPPGPPVIFPSQFDIPYLGGPFNPYYGGFGHWNSPVAGAGFTWPGFTFPFNFQPPFLYAVKARFVA
jgi:hypothetical protein